VAPQFSVPAIFSSKTRAAKLIILGAEEHRLAAITTLGDMMRQARNNHARVLASHSSSSSPCSRRCSLRRSCCAAYSWLPGAYTGFGGSGGGFFNAAARWRMYSK